MSIVISNMTPTVPRDEVNIYSVRINDDPHIAYFQHIPSDGLAACLRRAGEGVDKAEEEAKERFRGRHPEIRS